MNEFDVRPRSKFGGERGKREPVSFLAAAAASALVTRSGAPGMRALQGRDGAGRNGAGPTSTACSGAGGAVIAACAHMAGGTAAAAAPDPPDPPHVATSAQATACWPPCRAIDPAGQSNQN
jgi:hypothetical protein